jgi:4'-phosphopantetheinyl transferase
MKSFSIAHQIIVQTLPRQEIHESIYLGVIYGTINELCNHKEEYLHSSELQEIENYEYELKKHTFLLSRLASKVALIHSTGPYSINPCDFLIQNRIDGAPFISKKDLNLTISHSKNIGIACVSSPKIQIGIDLEFKIHFDSINLDHTVISSAEYNQLVSQSLFSESLIKCILWSAKEALAKYLKIGLSVDFNILSISTAIEYKNFIEIRFKYFRSLKVITYYTQNIVLSFCLNSTILFATEKNILVEILNKTMPRIEQIN